MIKKIYLKKIVISLLGMALLCTGCGKSQNDSPSAEEVYTQILSQPSGRQTEEKAQMPDYDSDKNLSTENATINITHINDGYVIFTYTGESDKVILQITQPDGSRYPYPVNTTEPQVITLVSGSGTYQCDVFEHKGNNAYVTDLSESIDVVIKDEFTPFLYPNQYACYTDESECVKLARNISDHSDTDLTYVRNVYDYVIAAIVYDKELAKNINTNYIPDPDATLQTRKGICFDYASLMTSMLRSQNIPTKLEVGYAGTAYHAWISVYIKDIGWIDNIIQFDGKNWSFMDPTVAANKDNSKEMKKLIGDGTTYTVQYHY